MKERDLYKFDGSWPKENEMTDQRGIAVSQSTFAALMRKVYTWMALALVITGFTAYGVAHSPALMAMIFGNQILFWGLIIAELALVFIVSGMINRLSLATATLLFILYSIINGTTLSMIFVAFSTAVIAKTFFITAGMFAAKNAAALDEIGLVEIRALKDISRGQVHQAHRRFAVLAGAFVKLAFVEEQSLRVRALIVGNYLLDVAVVIHHLSAAAGAAQQHGGQHCLDEGFHTAAKIYFLFITFAVPGRIVPSLPSKGG